MFESLKKPYERCLEIFRITAKFPKEERYGLTSQIRRSVESIPFNKVFKKQILESLNPGILGPSSPTKLEKNLNIRSLI
ncbi:four helix bundle protein [Thermodesulfobacteriota bacterium]